jgi:hypothetical protein
VASAAALVIIFVTWPKPNKPVTRGNKGLWGAKT